MRRPHLHILLLIVLACVLAPVPLTHGQIKSFAYRLVDVTLIINTDGSLDVTERFTLAYSGGPFTHVSRSIPHGNLTGISNISVSEGIQPYREQGGEEPGTFTVRQAPVFTLKPGSSSDVTMTQDEATTIDWYFAPVSDQERSFALSYRAEGAVRLDDAAYTLRWSAVHSDRGAPVDRSMVSLWFPPSVRPQQASVVLPAASGQTSIEERAMFVQRDQPLPDGESLDLRVRIPRESWPQGSRLPESASEDTPETADLSVIGALFAVPALGLVCCSVLLLAVPGALIWLVVRNRRKPKPSTLHHPRHYSKHRHGYDSDSDSSWSNDSDWSSGSSDSGGWSSSSDSGGSTSDSGGSDGGGSSSSD
ncbi:MAG TPA: DUF2207 domain-containing protein [Roseiflexaceae bacterium]|nr:DUF2207 domain-containing protein [Roseiflexaceae bacterium]